MSFKMVPFESSVYHFVFAFHSNHGSILYRFRDKARSWSKIAIFYVPPVHSTSQLGGPHQTIAIPFGILKLYHRSGDRRRECKVLFFWTLVLWRRFSFVSLLCNFV